MLAPGVYQLTRDVENSKPNPSRDRDWRSSPSWSAGTEFLAFRVEGRSSTRLVPTGVLHTYQVLYPHDPRYVALEAALSPAEESDDAVLTEIGAHDPFARWMLKAGKVSRGQLRQLWSEYRASRSSTGAAPPAPPAGDPPPASSRAEAAVHDVGGRGSDHELQGDSELAGSRPSTIASPGCVCAECGHEQATMDPCARCRSIRVVLVSVVRDAFGESWRDNFAPDSETHPGCGEPRTRGVGGR